MSDPLFTPMRINELTLENRIYLPAMHLGMGMEFEVTDQIVEFYARRARGGPAMICVGYCTVNDLAGNTQNIGAHHDRFIPGLARLARAIQENGSKAAAQINHAGRYNFSFFINGQKPVAPSPIASRMTREEPREMTLEDIQQTIADFASAARRIKEAGFDAVEVLSGTGYLISEFLSPLTNQRTDEYGGSLENRMRFGLEIAQAIREAVGPEYPLIYRINGNDFMAGGNDREELKAYARALAQGPVDALCINVGWHEARVPQIVTQVPRGAFVYLARGIREAVDVPVIASHRINDPETAREVLGEGHCDMVAMGRSLIADPDLPLKASQGRESEIIHCIACAQGCFDNLFKLKHVECLCNPMAGYEAGGGPEQAAEPKTVWVAGGGAAGMMAALTAHRRGHRVRLFEAGDRLGGQLFLAAAPPGRDEFAQFAADLTSQVELAGIPVELNCPVDKVMLEREKPHALIVATGAKPLVPPIPGLDLDHVVDAWDVLTERAGTGTHVAIIGGGAVGVETALFLAEKGTLDGETLKFLMVNQAERPEVLAEMAVTGSKKVTLLEMTDKVGKDIGKSTKWGMMQDVGRLGIETIPMARVNEITPRGLSFEQDGEEHSLAADTVVVAAGSTSVNRLVADAKALDIPVWSAGDARQVATAFEAVHQGYQVGMEV
ncbi:MAG: FAD-dependent oxidoreductase [Desulfobacterales bacterium]|nr:FAD-dependent oxidoreductase [Desulfobacterales bacterium]